MSSGKTHTKVTQITAVGTLAMGVTLGLGFFSIPVSVGVLGGLWFNPDLDLHKSDPSRRWGHLSWIWQPYRELFPHRGNFFRRNFWTHAPIISTFIRIAPLILLAFHVGWLFHPICVMLILGLVINDVSHLLADIAQSYFRVLY